MNEAYPKLTSFKSIKDLNSIQYACFLPLIINHILNESVDLQQLNSDKTGLN
jgi:hypothetical protein